MKELEGTMIRGSFYSKSIPKAACVYLRSCFWVNRVIESFLVIFCKKVVTVAQVVLERGVKNGCLHSAFSIAFRAARKSGSDADDLIVWHLVERSAQVKKLSLCLC